MQFVLVCAIFCLVLAWLHRRWQDRHTILLATKLPSHRLQVLLGFGPLLSPKETIKDFTTFAKNYGKNVLLYFGPLPHLVTSDPDTIQVILTSRLCLNKADAVYRGLSNAIGRGFITLDDQNWINDRKILNAAFNNKNLMSFMPVFNRRVSDLFRAIDSNIENDNHTPLILFFREFTLLITLETMLGRDPDKSHHDIRDYASRVASALEYASALTYNYIYLNGFIRKLADMTYFKKSVETLDILRTVISETFYGLGALRGTDPSYKTDITTVLDYMDRGIKQNVITPENAIGDLMHMFVGAFETTSTNLYYSLILLAMHPEYQERAYAEICDIVSDNGGVGECEVTYENIVQMVYLDMIFNETMRVMPVLPLVGRKVAGGNVALSNGVVLPDGLEILLDIYSLHRSKEIWGPDAHKFKPDNFLPCNIKARHPYAFIPFTKGVRFCIGMRYANLSIKVALARLIKRYKFSTSATMEDLIVENHVTLQLTNNPPLVFERRRMTKSV